jgi:hypothetical protein
LNRIALCSIAVGLSVALASFAGCGAARAGDTCPDPCPSPTMCEAVCECGNASCPAYACVTISSTGEYQLADGGQVMSCSAL